MAQGSRLRAWRRDGSGVTFSRTFGTADDSMFEDVADMSEDWPYCECGNETDEEEEAFNVCKCCGKPIT